MSEPESALLKVVEEKLAQTNVSTRNKAALGALVKAIPGMGEALHHALNAGDEAVAAKRGQIQLELLCALAEKIDSNISEMIAEANRRDAPFADLSGIFNVFGENASNVTGLDVSSGRSVSVKPGTVFNVDGKNVSNITGVKL